MYKAPLSWWIIFWVLNGIGAQSLYTVDTLYPVHALDDFMVMIADTGGMFTVEELRRDTTIVWQPRSAFPQRLDAKSVYWGKLRLYAPTGIGDWQLDFRDLCFRCPAWVRGNGSIDVYAFHQERLLYHRRSGVDIPAGERDRPDNFVVNRVLLPLPAGDTTTLFVRIAGNSFGFFPAFDMTLRHPAQLFTAPWLERVSTFNVFLLGVAFITFLYYLLLFLYLRQRVFFWFSLWLLLCTVTQSMAVGFDPIALFPNVPSFRFTLWLIIPNFTLFSFWMFGREFTESRRKFPRLDRFMLALPVLLVVETVGQVVYYLVFDPPVFVTQFGIKYPMIAIFGLAGLLLSVVLASRKDSFARYFGWGAVAANLMIVIGAFWSMGYFRLPIDPYSTSFFLQIVIYSFGIAFRQQRISARNRATELVAREARAEIDRMRDLEDLKTRFFANVSHEFRTPLSLILGHLGESGRAVGKTPGANVNPPSPPSGRSLAVIRRNAERLNVLVEQLLELSHLEGDQAFLKMSEGGLVAFIRSVIFSFESMAERRNLSLNVSFPAEPKYALYDRDKLEKIITNLMSNALKYTPSGGVVTVSLSHDDRCFHLEVADTGPGIPPGELRHVFERFYRVEGSEVRGSGIGLALTKELVDLHGGRIQVENNEGSGSIFRVSLPYVRSEFPDDIRLIEAAAEQAIKVEPITAFKGSRPDGLHPEAADTHPTVDLPLVLVVEDNPDLRNYISGILAPGYRVLLAADGERGERMAYEHVPDLVVSDVMMPGQDGFALCHKLKNNPKTSHVPVLLLTAKAGQDNKMAGLLQGADAYLTKPFDAEELRLRLRNLFENRQKLWNHFQSLDLSLLADTDIRSVDDEFLQSVISTIKGQLDNEHFSVDDLARTVGFSRSQLHRKLKALTDKSANQLIVEIRLNEARRLLENKVGSVSEVAYSVGYANLSYFTKSFKQAFGVLPSKIGEKTE